MKDRRNLEMVGMVHDANLKQALRHSAQFDSQRHRMLGDAHLIETARRADRVVCSRDDSVRLDFSRYAGLATQLAAVVWVNPSGLMERRSIRSGLARGMTGIGAWTDTPSEPWGFLCWLIILE